MVNINRLAACLFFPVVFVTPLFTQTSDRVDIYNSQVYYLKIDSRPFSRTAIKATNPHHEFTVAKLGFFGPNFQEDFFADSPEAMDEIKASKQFSHNAALYAGTAIAFMTGCVFLQDNYNYNTDLLYWPILGIAYFGAKQSVKAENYFRRALRARNLHSLKKNLPTEVYEDYSSNSMVRVIRSLTRTQVVMGQRPYDVPRFLFPSPETDRLFEGSRTASAAYGAFIMKKRQSARLAVMSHGVLLGSMFWIALTPPPRLNYSRAELSGLYAKFGIGVLGSIALAKVSGFAAMAAENHLNLAVYLYNQGLLEEMVSENKP